MPSMATMSSAGTRLACCAEDPGGTALTRTLTLSNGGPGDLAYRLLLRREFPSWLFPVVKGGATTIWERWDGWTEENGF